MRSSSKLIGLILVIILTQCIESYGQAEKFDYGRVEKGIYQNDYFNLSMKLPDNWVVQSKEQTAEMSKRGKVILAGEDENMKAFLDASEVNTANLLTAFQYEVGTPVNSNPVIAIVSENLRIQPGIKKGSDYLFHARRVLLQGQLKFDYVSDEFEREVINETEFYKMDVLYSGVEVKQTYYATIVKGFCVLVLISHSTEQERKVILESLNTLTFKKS